MRDLTLAFQRVTITRIRDVAARGRGSKGTWQQGDVAAGGTLCLRRLATVS